MARVENGASKLCRALSNGDFYELLDSVEAFLFDCDGVIWKGDRLIDGVPRTLEMLRSKGKKIVFVTNNSMKSRKQYATKFRKLGLEVNEEEIFSSSFAAAMYLKLNSFPQEKKVYVIGEEGILEELKLAGFTCFGGPEDSNKSIQLKSDFMVKHDENVGAVVVGIDPHINYYKLHELCACQNYQQEVNFNKSKNSHVNADKRAGCMVGAICGSTQKEPIVVGKPSTFMMDFLVERFQIDTTKMCMVGDRLDTDILFGQNAGCKTLLVLTGVTTSPMLEDSLNTIHPDYYTSKVSDILNFLGD
ncbi:Phosphoglycolate phosphatase 2 [Acorus gramineus]|uniref:Phosphoglycolate phosphatase n=1 Tax=Acorus gramineus TaxID=55184 RepID=A0AAV9BCB0_ACOGR|nr:Phosphoglycolate phosphatase 2 [Acorus gramineus]